MKRYLLSILLPAAAVSILLFYLTAASHKSAAPYELLPMEGDSAVMKDRLLLGNHTMNSAALISVSGSEFAVMHGSGARSIFYPFEDRIGFNRFHSDTESNVLLKKENRSFVRGHMDEEQYFVSRDLLASASILIRDEGEDNQLELRIKRQNQGDVSTYQIPISKELEEGRGVITLQDLQVRDGQAHVLAFRSSGIGDNRKYELFDYIVDMDKGMTIQALKLFEEPLSSDEKKQYESSVVSEFSVWEPSRYALISLRENVLKGSSESNRGKKMSSLSIYDYEKGEVKPMPEDVFKNITAAGMEPALHQNAILFMNPQSTSAKTLVVDPATGEVLLRLDPFPGQELKRDVGVGPDAAASGLKSNSESGYRYMLDNGHVYYYGAAMGKHKVAVLNLKDGGTAFRGEVQATTIAGKNVLDNILLDWVN